MAKKKNMKRSCCLRCDNPSSMRRTKFMGIIKFATCLWGPFTFRCRRWRGQGQGLNLTKLKFNQSDIYLGLSLKAPSVAYVAAGVLAGLILASWS